MTSEEPNDILEDYDAFDILKDLQAGIEVGENIIVLGDDKDEH